MTSAQKTFQISNEAPTAWIHMPHMSEVFSHPEHIPESFFRPLLKVDGGEIDEKLKGIPLVILAHEVGVDEISCKIDDDGGYQLANFNGTSIPPDAIRDTLFAIIEDTYGGLEELIEENEELFDEEEPRAFLLEVNDEDEDVEISLNAEWIQNTSEDQPTQSPDFAFALISHPILFGVYYLFVDIENRIVRQVFQCT